MYIKLNPWAHDSQKYKTILGNSLSICHNKEKYYNINNENHGTVIIENCIVKSKN